MDADAQLRPGGDGGKDFTLTVDVKTARKAGHLLVEVGKVRADIYCLAQFSDATGEAALIGWATKREVQAAPVKDMGYGIPSHAIPAEQLRPMAVFPK